jgi:hypothetical protein
MGESLNHLVWLAHPHLDVTYSISIGTYKGGKDVISMKNVGTSLSHKETGLSLTPYQVI